jgi:transcriptional regulator with XRE-family HTH domain
MKSERSDHSPSHKMTLRELRESVKLSQSQVEKISQGKSKFERIPQTTLSGWERGDVGMRDHEMLILAAIYDVHPFVIFDACYNTRRSILD